MNIELKNLTKTYQDNLVFDEINFKISDNSKFIITGKSGIGKTTLLKIISLLDWDFSGDLLIDGISTRKMKRKDLEIARGNFSYMFQEYALLEDRTVKENVEIPLLFSKKNNIETIRNLLDILDISSQINKKVSQLSGGQRQRVALARALIANKNAILLDEPFNSIDEDTAKKILSWISKEFSNKIVIIATHQLDYYKDFAYEEYKIISSNKIIPLE